jgi:hypothetical protein
MSVARITTVTFDSKEAADIAAVSYVPNAPSDFPESLAQAGTSGNSGIHSNLNEINCPA